MNALVWVLGAVGIATFAATAAYAQVPPVQLPPAPPPSPSATAGITQGTWVWQRTDYAGGTSAVPSDPTSYTVTFRGDGRAAILADCNTASAAYTIEGSSLTFGPAATSLVACPPGSLDTVFLQDLSRVTTYSLTGDQLSLSFDGGTLTFSPLPPPSLLGVTWRVTGVNNGRGGLQSVETGTQLSAVFGADGRVSGDTGCNMYSGPYTLVGSSLSFGPMITTRRACLSDAANAQEQAFLNALAATSTYELLGATLTLRDADGAMQLTLVRPVN